MKKIIIFSFLCVCIFAVFLFVIFNYCLYPTKYSEYVVAYSEEYNLDKALVFAIIKTESDFDSGAVSSSGALGLMQLLPSTADWIASEFGEDYSDENMFVSETNIKYGCFYLNYLFSKFENLDIVICAYNAGEGAVKNWLDEKGELDIEKISYSETLNYYKKVKSSYSFYKNHEVCF